MAITQARAFGACTGRRYGSFDRTAAARDVGTLTQPLGFGAHASRRYGAFDRTAAGRNVGTLTQPLGFGAHAGRRYGSFAGRSAVAPSPAPAPTGIRLPRHLVEAQRARKVTADEILMLMAAQIAAGLLH